MLQRGLTDAGQLRLLAWLPALVLGAGCSMVGPERPVAAAPGPDPAVTVRHEAAVARLQAGDDAGARPLLVALVREHPGHGGPLLNLALLEARAGREEVALAWLAQAAAVCQRCGAVWNELGMIRRRQGRFEDAEAAYRRALQVEPGYSLAQHNLAVLYDLYLQRPELALVLYQQYLDSTTDPAAGAEVEKWVADLRRRTRVPEAAARAEGES